MSIKIIEKKVFKLQCYIMDDKLLLKVKYTKGSIF